MSYRDEKPGDGRDPGADSVAVWTVGGFVVVLLYMLALILLKRSL